VKIGCFDGCLVVVVKLAYYPSSMGPVVIVLRRAIMEVKLRWSVIGCVIKNLSSRAPPCFGRHVKPMVPAAFAVVSTNQPALGVVGYGRFSLCVIHKEGLWQSSRNINRLMMMMMTTLEDAGLIPAKYKHVCMKTDRIESGVFMH
jgi:hypothetical protein